MTFIPTNIKITYRDLQNFQFFKFFYYFFGDIKNGHILDQINKFATSLKNSKKILKNIKFGFQGNFNMEIIFNGSGRSFEHLNHRYDDQAPLHPCSIKYRSITLIDN